MLELTDIEGVGEKTQELLGKLQIHNIED